MGWHLMSEYMDFSAVYDVLTREIDYPKRAAYFDEVIRKNGGFRGILLELGCGTGSLCEAMARTFKSPGRLRRFTAVSFPQS